MIPLWLEGKRVDNVYELRQRFESLKDDEEKCKLCIELLKKVHEKIFIPWLNFDSETSIFSKKQYYLKKDKTDFLHVFNQKLHRWAAQLEPGDLTDEEINSIAEICDVSSEIMQKANAVIKKEKIDDCRWLRKVETQKWYQEAKAAKDTLIDTLSCQPPESIVWDSRSLANALMDISRNENKRTLYLLNTEKIFIIENIDYLKNVTLIGCGAPVLKIACPNNTKLNMKENDIAIDKCLLRNEEIFTEKDGRIR